MNFPPPYSTNKLDLVIRVTSTGIITKSIDDTHKGSGKLKN